MDELKARVDWTDIQVALHGEDVESSEMIAAFDFASRMQESYSAHLKINEHVIRQAKARIVAVANEMVEDEGKTGIVPDADINENLVRMINKPFEKSINDEQLAGKLLTTVDIDDLALLAKVMSVKATIAVSRHATPIISSHIAWQSIAWDPVRASRIRASVERSVGYLDRAGLL